MAPSARMTPWETPVKAKPTSDELLDQRSVIVEFGRTALKSDSLDEILSDACHLCSEALHTEFAKVMKLEDEGRSLRVIAGVGWQDGVVGEEVVPALYQSSEGFALFDGRPALSDDLTKDAFDYPAFLERHGVKSILNVIIPGADGRPPFGLLQVDSREPKKFDQSHVEFLQSYANIVGAAIERFDRSEALRAALNDRERALDELHHRVKNNLSVLQSLIRARVAKAKNSLVRQEASLLLGKIETLVKLHDVLSTTSDIDQIDLGGFLSALVSQLGSFGSDDRIVCEVRTETEPVLVPTRFAIPMGIVANEFVTNSLKHGTRDGRCSLFLSVKRSDDAVQIVLQDGGGGLGDALDHHGDPQTGSGLTFIETLLKQLRADRSWSSDSGAALTIELPLARTLPASIGPAERR